MHSAVKDKVQELAPEGKIAGDLEVGGSDFIGRLPGQSDGFELYQNRPNPFRSSTMIGFYLPASESARLSIYDMQGRMLTVVEGNYLKGYNEVEINASQLGVTGVLYYRLETGTHTSTRRMIITP